MTFPVLARNHLFLVVLIMDLVFIIASIVKMWQLYVTLQTVSLSFRELNASQFNHCQFKPKPIRPQVNSSKMQCVSNSPAFLFFS